VSVLYSCVHDDVLVVYDETRIGVSERVTGLVKGMMETERERTRDRVYACVRMHDDHDHGHGLVTQRGICDDHVRLHPYHHHHRCAYRVKV